MRKRTRILNRILCFLMIFGIMSSVVAMTAFATSDVSTQSVTVSGTATVGNVLTATTSGIDESATVSYQWMRESSAIDGATGTSYTITDADVGCGLKIVVNITLADQTTMIESSETDKVQPSDPDALAVYNAKNAVDNAGFLDPTKESDYADEAALQAYVTKLVTAAINNSAVTVTIEKLNYVTAIDGTAENPSGTTGSYEFQVVIASGSQSATTSSRSIVIPAVYYTFATYEVLEGASQTVDFGESVAVSFTIDGVFADFQSLYCDGVQLDASCYSVAEGTVVITVAASYVETLTEGTHEFTAMFSGGSASVVLTVQGEVEEAPEEEPEEEDDSEESTQTETPTEDDSDQDEAEEDLEDAEDTDVDQDVAEDEDPEFEESDEEEPAKEIVKEADEVNSNILWITLIVVLVVVVLEIIFVRKTRRRVRAVASDEGGAESEEELEEDAEEELEEDFEE